MTADGRHGATPLPSLIARALRERILDGTYATGDRLPPELALAREFEVSRETVRRALDVLGGDGTVSREQGRGTFVRRVPTRRRGYTLRGDLDDFLRKSAIGREPDATVRLVPVDEFPDAVQARLDCGDRPGMRVERVLTEDGTPYGLLIDSVPAPFDTHITHASLARGGVAQALDAAGVRVVRATQFMGATNATDDVARQLGLSAGDAVLLVERTLHAETAAVASTISYYVGELYRDVVEFTRDQ